MVYQVSIAPPVMSTSVIFMAASIEIIDMSDIPQAVLNANISAICLVKMTVSSAIEVINPLNIARSMILIVVHPESGRKNWKNAMVPKSPIEQPMRHHFVLWADCFQTAPSFQLNSGCPMEKPAPVIAPSMASESAPSCCTTADPTSASTEVTPWTPCSAEVRLDTQPWQDMPPTS